LVALVARGELAQGAISPHLEVAEARAITEQLGVVEVVEVLLVLLWVMVEMGVTPPPALAQAAGVVQLVETTRMECTEMDHME